MIISASRRTDIPAYFSEWFFNRVKEGSVAVRNPFNFHQVSNINISPDVVDGIVFWTKNPSPMIDKIPLLKDYAYYFQFTVTPYDHDIEANVPNKEHVIVPTFKRLSDIVGPERVIWRYDPILLNKTHTVKRHVEAFERLAGQLSGYTKTCVISFIDTDYRNVKKNICELGLEEISEDAQLSLAEQCAQIAHAAHIQPETCAETIDLEKFRIGHAHCIDKNLLEKLSGFNLDVGKDPLQRPACGCATSVDIGVYNTCRNGCAYCYANYSQPLVEKNQCQHNTRSPLMCGTVREDDTVTERAALSHRICHEQLSLL